MGVIDEFVIPIFKTMMTIAFIGFACFGFYKMIRSFLPKEINAWMKFKLLRKPYPEKDIAWCLKAYENEATPVEVEKYLRIIGTPDARVENTVYIFKQIIKLKGGKINNGRFKESSLKTFSRGSEEKTNKEKGKS